MGIGVDVVDTERFAAVIERTPGLVARVFTDRLAATRVQLLDLYGAR